MSRPEGVLRDAVAVLDHLVYAAPDLEETARRLGERLGVAPAPGGRHLGLGTANALLALGPGAYLEVIGPDRDAPPPGRPRPFGIDRLTAPRLAGWAARSAAVDDDAAAARGLGYDPGPVEGMTRDLPDGGRLAWRLTRPADAGEVEVVPFLIDWGGGPHPAATAPGGVRLVAFGAQHWDPGAVRARCAALGLALLVEPGAAAGLWARLDTPLGQVELR